jgi:hypothetical protein
MHVTWDDGVAIIYFALKLKLAIHGSSFILVPDWIDYPQRSSESS